MAKRTIESLGVEAVTKGSKKSKTEKGAKNNKKVEAFEVTPKMMLGDSDTGSEEEDVDQALTSPEFKINPEFAKRFEHNKKREEIQRLEGKLSKSKPGKSQSTDKPYGDKYDEDSESSDDEDEDDEGFLATKELDAEISATLQAIRNKDPAVYNENVSFYAPIRDGDGDSSVRQKVAKPMHLRDYHRANLLSGYTGAEEVEEEAPRTFRQEQDDLKKSVIQEMHAIVNAEIAGVGVAESDSDEFLKAKVKPQKTSDGPMHPSRAKRAKVALDPEIAEKDPETFLSNFLTARAWVPEDGAQFLPLESDDEAEDALAEKFEAAYNMRFEDPAGSNEALKSYARDIVAARSVRREDVKGRKKKRELEADKKQAEKAEREADRARLRKLKIEEMEERLKKIKHAAGIKSTGVHEDDWIKFLDENWNDADWEREMNKRFNDNYYAAADEISGEDEVSSKKHKKPAWDDDIDIKDLVPDFEDDSVPTAKFDISDMEDDAEGNAEDDEFEGSASKSKSNKDRKQERAAGKKAARLERQKIESLVDEKLDIEHATLGKQSAVFRYRETSPISYGLTARDILLADDTALNQWAGLKKLASFRDAEKKRKDKKRLSKKARLREWRKETFGNEDGPQLPQAEAGLGGKADQHKDAKQDDGIKKKHRSRASKKA